MMKTIKNRSVTKAGATRQHAEAMSIEDLRSMMEWSEAACPNEWFGREPSDFAMMKLMNTHGFMRAFATTGFNLFTR